MGEHTSNPSLGETLSHAEPDVTTVETLCMQCMKNEVIVSSFECDHCGYSNREIQSAAALNERGGCQIELRVQTLADINRQIVRSEAATLSIPEVELECPPPANKRATLNTVEGCLQEIIGNLQGLQAQQRNENAELVAKLDVLIAKLHAYAAGSQLPFTLRIDDPSGNSFIEPFRQRVATDAIDPQITMTWYRRTPQQLQEMGYAGGAETTTERHRGTELLTANLPNQLKLAGWDLAKPVEENVALLSQVESTDLSKEGISFSVQCPHCGRQGSNDMCSIDIPGFRRCLIMSFLCVHCGSRSNEVKPMGAYGEKAKRWTLRVETPEDLNRDVLKSDTASVSIPEVDLVLCTGTLGGVFTTVEGLLLKIVEQLRNTSQLFSGDSADTERREMFLNLLATLEKYTTDPDALPFTLILDDAADLSMISHSRPTHCLPGQTPVEHQQEKPDPNLVVESYERTPEQNDELGLTHMKTEGYEEED